MAGGLRYETGRDMPPGMAEKVAVQLARQLQASAPAADPEPAPVAGDAEQRIGEQQMANEKRMIDYEMARNATYEEVFWKESEQAVVRNFLAKLPKVDAVEVVRCMQCRDCELCYPEKQLDKEASEAWFCNRYKLFRRPDDFCSYGERRNDG